LKVILCLHHFLPEFVGGTEIYTFNLAKQLIQQNIEVVMLIPNLGVGNTEEYDYEGVRVIKYAENSVEDRAMILGKKKPDGIKIFGELLIKEQPSLVHFHELAPGRGISIFHVEKAYQLKIPIVITFHVPFYTCFKGSLIYKEATKCDGEIKIDRCTACVYHQKGITGFKGFLFNKFSMGLYDLHINPTGLNSKLGTALGLPYVISKIKKDLVKLSSFSERIVVIACWYKQVLERNKVPVEKITFIKQGLPVKRNNEIKSIEVNLPIRVVYMGRITQLKGLHLLIDAILELPSSSISLTIYGLETPDPYVLACKEKTKNAGNIFWKGRIAPSEVISTFSEYHLLCLPSAFEMSPLVIQEAFAAGIPVLASDVYGNAEQIKDGFNGWLFRFNDSEDLRNKLKILVDDPSLIAKTKKHLPGVNTFENVANHHLKLYDSIIQNYKAH